MLHPETPYCAAIVVAHLLLLSVEAYTLVYDTFGFTSLAPDAKRHFKTNYESIVGREFAGASPKRVALRVKATSTSGGEGGIEGGWRMVATHIEALHFGCGGAALSVSCLCVDLLFCRKGGQRGCGFVVAMVEKVGKLCSMHGMRYSLTQRNTEHVTITGCLAGCLLLKQQRRRNHL
jgi:hypothetical protein